jgi:murein L,D-transpeptidase YafK
VVLCLFCLLAAGQPRGAELLRELPADLRKAPVALLAMKSTYRLHLFAAGKLIRTYVIGLGQSPSGPKQKEGDNRTPEGRYTIIQKAMGPFSGDYGAYLGTRWLRISYPNDDDARAALDKGTIDRATFDRIVAANKVGREPPRNTGLGGGIGIHGWNGKWPGKDKQNVTWGCLSLQNEDVEDLYARVPVGTTIVIRP